MALPVGGGSLRGGIMLALLLSLSLTNTLPSSALVLRNGALLDNSTSKQQTTRGRKREQHGCGAARELASQRRGAFVPGSGGIDLRRRGAYRTKPGVGVGACTMALQHKMKKARNVPGDFFVDESCVDCDICCWMAPSTFKRSGLGAVVAAQPRTEEARMSTFQAMLACPSGSIRTMRPDRQVIDALASFPIAVDKKRLPGIYQLAPTTRASLGNTPYLIVRPGKGNIMIDVPRYLTKTVESVEALGGVRYLIVTGRENAAGHEYWKRKFPGMIRVLHRLDLARNTRVMEERLDGNGPWYMVKQGKESEKDGYVTGATARFDFSKAPEKDRAPKDPTVKIVGMPGQTRGSIGVVYEMEAEGGGVERVAFTGGSVGLPSYLESLYTFPRTIELDKDTLASSVRRLAKESVTCILPGRGRRVLYEEGRDAVEDLIEAAEGLAAIPDLSMNRLLVDPRYS